MKNILVELKKLLMENKKYSTSDLYVCKFRSKVDGEISERCICKVVYPMIATVLTFERLDTHETFKVKCENDEYVEVLEMISFLDVYPEIFHPSLGTINSLTEELRKNEGPIKTLR